MNAPDEHSRAPKYALCPVDQIQMCGVTTSLERPRPRRWPPAGCVGLQERWHDHWSPAWGSLRFRSNAALLSPRSMEGPVPVGLCHRRRRPASSERWSRAALSFPVAIRRSASIFSFEPGVYQRQSLVVDLGAAVPRGHRLGSLVRTCRRRTPPATPVWPTFFAPQRTHAPKPFRPR